MGCRKSVVKRADLSEHKAEGAPAWATAMAYQIRSHNIFTKKRPILLKSGVAFLDTRIASVDKSPNNDPPHSASVEVMKYLWTFRLTFKRNNGDQNFNLSDERNVGTVDTSNF